VTSGDPSTKVRRGGSASLRADFVEQSGAVCSHVGELSGENRAIVAAEEETCGNSFDANSWVVAARASQQLESVTISRGGKMQEIPCDYLACGFHLVPNVELPALLGCELANGFVRVDEFQQTTVPGVFCAGEPTGIGGVESALVAGEIAGFAAVGETKRARNLYAQRKKAHRFAQAPHFRFAPAAEGILPKPRLWFAAARMFRSRGCSRIRHGARPSCRRAAAWVHVRGAFADPR
jgi:pyridine nucleotide-disulfide oxidoreductase